MRLASSLSLSAFPTVALALSPDPRVYFLYLVTTFPFLRRYSYTAFLVEVFEHKLVVFYPRLSFYQIPFMDRLEFPCLANFLYGLWILKAKVECWFSVKPARRD
jgi:hypothetical protein